MEGQYTPIDTLVFGGNFLHSYDVAIRAFKMLSFSAVDSILRLRTQST